MRSLHASFGLSRDDNCETRSYTKKFQVFGFRISSLLYLMLATFYFCSLLSGVVGSGVGVATVKQIFCGFGSMTLKHIIGTDDVSDQKDMGSGLGQPMVQE